MTKFSSILFVCLGNICRSPIAEGVAREIARKNNLHIVIDSAGTSSHHSGENPCKNSVLVARQNGIDISKLRARGVSKEDFNKYDMIIALDSSNLYDLQSMGCDKCIKLGEYGYGGRDVPDPYFFDGFDGFDKVYEMISTCVSNIFREYHNAKDI